MADTKITALTELAESPAVDDLLTLVDISDTMMAASGTNKKITVANALAAPTQASITGATTLVSSDLSVSLARLKWHVCSGTTADYTVTLPAVSGNAGKYLGIRMATGLTKLVTLDGNASEAIDGALTRVMWEQEAAILLCDGSNWFKIAGKARPMYCRMYRSTNQTGITTSTVVKILVNGTTQDNTGAMADITNSRINIKRSALYTAIGTIMYNAPPAAKDYEALTDNSTSVGISQGAIPMYTSAGYPTPSASGSIFLDAGDNVKLSAYHNAGTDQSSYGGSLYTWFSVAETPSW